MSYVSYMVVNLHQKKSTSSGKDPGQRTTVPPYHKQNSLCVPKTSENNFILYCNII